MAIDKFNAEGYFDPVVYEALTKIEKEERAARKAAAFRPMVYVCSPYSGDIEKNTANARMYSRFAVAKNTKVHFCRCDGSHCTQGFYNAPLSIYTYWLFRQS